MNGKNTPRGLVVLTAVAVAFLLGVFVPSADLEANLSSNSGETDDGSGTFVETHGPGGFPDGSSGGGNTTGPGTRDADPDWPTPGGWSTDFVLVPDHQSDVRVPVLGPLGQLFGWFLNQDWLMNQVDSRYTERVFTTVTPRR